MKMIRPPIGLVFTTQTGNNRGNAKAKEHESMNNKNANTSVGKGSEHS